MGIQPILSFEFSYQGDGVATQVQIDVKNGPVVFLLPDSNATLSPFLADLEDATITDLQGGFFAISSFTYQKGILTVNFTSPPSGEIGAFKVTGRFNF